MEENSTLRGDNAEHVMRRDPDPHAEYIELESDLMIVAFQIDITRVCTLAVEAMKRCFQALSRLAPNNAVT